MNGLFCGNTCTWVLILVIVFLLSNNGEFDYGNTYRTRNGNGCGCGNTYRTRSGNGCGCGCDDAFDNDSGCGCSTCNNGCGCY